MVAATLIAARVVLDRGLAWALAVAGLVVAATCFIAVILAWRAVAAAKLAAKVLEELRRNAIPREPAPASPEPLAPVAPTEPLAPVAPTEPVAPVAPAKPIQLPDLPSRIPAALWAEPLDPREPRPEPLPSRPPPSGPPDIARWEVVVPSQRPSPPREQPPIRPPGPPPVEEQVTPPPTAVEPEPPGPPTAETPTAETPTAETLTPIRPFVESRPPLPSGEETSLLLRALDDRDPFVRQRAVAALAGRTEAEGALADALRDEYPMVRREVVRALRRAGRSLAVQALVEVVSQDPSAEVREEAVIVLADFLHPGNSNSSTQS
jgi:hypothetical protein